MPRKSTRRSFLVGQSALDALADLPDQIAPVDAEANAGAAPGTRPAMGQGTYLVQVARDAMACQFQVFLNAGQHTGAVEAAISGLDRVEEIEDLLTVYRPTSDVSRLNACQPGPPVAVDEDLFELLLASERLHRETQGAFDITAGPLVRLWGFQRREGKLPDPEAIRETLECVGTKWVSLDKPQQSVWFEREGVEINFGAIGKGYALDLAAKELAGEGVTDFLIHGGHSSILAHGSRQSAEQDQPGWRVALRHPLRQDIRLAEIRLQDRALGTSGSGNQFFHFEGKRYGHVLDPRSGYPADEMLSATVLAPNAMLADALSTAFFVMGVDATLEFCEQRDDLAVILACQGAKEGAIQLCTCGLADDEWELLQADQG